MSTVPRLLVQVEGDTKEKVSTCCGMILGALDELNLEHFTVDDLEDETDPRTTIRAAVVELMLAVGIAESEVEQTFAYLDAIAGLRATPPQGGSH